LSWRFAPLIVLGQLLSVEFASYLVIMDFDTEASKQASRVVVTWILTITICKVELPTAVCTYRKVALSWTYYVTSLSLQDCTISAGDAHFNFYLA